MKTTTIVGWVMSLIAAIFLIGLSASGKFTDWEGKQEMFDKFGFTIELMKYIGIVEVLCTILFLIPQTGFLGAILLTGYLGGATVTHVRIDDPFYMPIIIGVWVWVALGLRNPEIFRLAFGACMGNPKSKPASTPQA